MEKKNNSVKNKEIKILLEDIFEIFQKVETKVTNNLENIIKLLEVKNELDFVIKYGIEGFRKKVIESYNTKNIFNPHEWLFKITQKEPLLRFPHRKILEYLSSQYDYEQKRFKEVNYNKIVKECRIGKNKAKEYLKLLSDKGFIKERFDGYRVWYRVNGK